VTGRPVAGRVADGGPEATTHGTELVRSTPFVGREPELEELRGLIDRPAGSSGTVAFITGEAGIGKTRLMEEARRHATGRGMACFTARCEEAARDVPYAPWIDILRETLRLSPRSAVRQAAATSFDALVKLLPEVADRVWLVPRPGREMRELGAVDFLRRLTEYFVRLSATVPSLITIDDLALADEASLDLLRSLGLQTAQSPLCILVGARDSQLAENQRLQQLLATLLKEKRARELSLGRLDSAHVRQIIAGALSEHHVQPDFVDVVFQRSEGNPFFVEEILASLIAQGSIVRTGTGWEGLSAAEIRIPAGVRSLIHQRLWRLKEREALVLRSASVLGTSFRLDVVKGLLNLPDSALVESIEGAVAAKLLREARDASGAIRYEFSHPLIGEVLLEDVSLVRRTQLHLAAAHALELVPGGATAENAATLAYHYLRGDDSPRALEFSITAGDHAARIYARAAAIDHYRAALKLFERLQPSARRWEVQERLADQLLATGDDREAARQYDGATDGFIHVGQPVRAAECMVKRAISEHPHPRQAHELLRRAAALVPGNRQSETLCRIHLQTVHVLYQEGRVIEARRLAKSTLEMASRLRLPAEEISACLELAKTLPTTGRSEAAELIERALRTAEKNQLPELVAKAIGWRVTFHLAAEGSLAAALAELGSVTEATRRVGNVGQEVRWQEYPIPLYLFLHGDFRAAAEMTVKAGLKTGGSAPTGRPHSAVIRAAAAVALGDRESALRLLSESLTQLQAQPHWYLEVLTELSYARFELNQGRVAAAGRHLSKARALGVRAGPSAWHAFLHLSVLALLVRVDLLSESRAKGQAHLAEIEEIADQMGLEFPWGFVARARAQLYTDARNYPAARRELEKSIDIWTRLDWRYEMAGAWQEFGAVCRLQGRPAESKQAYARAEELYGQMGAVPEVDPGPPMGSHSKS
jgi:tetratricopeptide (TPR) repeat protein